jgi:type IV secretory pathway VirB6-like protein
MFTKVEKLEAIGKLIKYAEKLLKECDSINNPVEKAMKLSQVMVAVNQIERIRSTSSHDRSSGMVISTNTKSISDETLDNLISGLKSNDITITVH